MAPDEPPPTPSSSETIKKRSMTRVVRSVVRSWPPVASVPMRGKWARGIVPRNFYWIIKDRLAVCERPGGFGENHRRVRRQEEIIWLRENGFDVVISLLASEHNLHNYDE